MKSIRVTRDRVSEVLVAVRRMDATRVLVGVPSDTEQPHRSPTSVGPNVRVEPGAPTNAELAAIHDLGAPELNIPARPFMEPGIARVLPTIEAHLETAGIAMLGGDSNFFDQQMNLAGLVAVDGIHRTIEDGIPPPLSPVTLAHRQARAGGGKFSTTPLLDTRQLYNSISYVIRGPK